MANFHAYRVEFDGPGRYCVGGNSYAAGDLFILTEDMARRVIKTADIALGYITYMGETDSADGIVSTNMQNYLDGKPGSKYNTLPAVSFDISLPDTAFDTVNSLALFGFLPRRRMALSHVIATAGAWPLTDNGAGTIDLDNRVNLLVTKGDAGAVTAQITTHGWLDDNGTMVSLGLPDTGTVLDSSVAAQDAIYLGYSSKFSALYIDIVAASPNSTASVMTGSYWDGSAWVAFENFVDMTVSTGITLAADGMIAWFEKPSAWVKGGTATTAATALDDGQYWIQLVTSGGLDADTEIERISVPDEEPLIQLEILGTDGRFDAVILENNITLTDETAAFASTAAAGLVNVNAGQWTQAEDAIYFGHRTRFGGLLFDVGTTVNAVAQLATYEYWNGYEWVTLPFTDGTVVGGAAWAADGDVSWTMPLAWKAATASEITLPATAPTTLSTTALYWVRVSFLVADPTPNFDFGPNCMPMNNAAIAKVFYPEADCMIDSHEQINIHVGEIEAQTDTLTSLRLSFVGADI